MHLRHKSTALLLVASLALLLRGGVVFSALDQFDADPDAYRAIAESISQNHVFGLSRGDQPPNPTAYRPPLYPYLLSWLTIDGTLNRLPVAILHVILGMLTVLLVYWTAQSLSQQYPQNETSPESSRLWRRVAAPVAAGLVAIDPILLRHSQLVMTETLATALVAAILWVWVRWDPAALRGDSKSKPVSWVQVFLLGVLLAAAYLCRPTFLVWAAWMVLIVFVATWRHQRSVAFVLKRTIPIIAILGLALGAWTARNARVLGHPIWATSHGGYTLLLGNNESFYDYLEDGQFGRAWDATHFLSAYQHRYDGDPNQRAFWQKEWRGPRLNRYPVTEHDDDRKSYDAAIATIRRRPATFLWSSVVKICRVFSPLPHDTAVSSSFVTVGVGLFYLSTYVAILIAVYRHGKKLFALPTLPMWTLLLTLMMVHAFYWSNMRMRAPAIPALSLLAASVFLPTTQRDATEGPAEQSAH